MEVFMKIVKSLFKILIISFAVWVFICAGCQQVLDLYPTKIPKRACEYAETPKPGWESVGAAKEIRQEVIDKHTEKQIDLKYQMELDQAKYAAALSQIDTNIRQAEAERQVIIGTADKPGWGLTALLAITGLGTFFAGLNIPRSEDKQAINNLQMENATLRAITYTADEVRALLARQKSGENISV